MLMNGAIRFDTQQDHFNIGLLHLTHLNIWSVREWLNQFASTRFGQSHNSSTFLPNFFPLNNVMNSKVGELSICLCVYIQAAILYWSLLNGLQAIGKGHRERACSTEYSASPEAEKRYREKRKEKHFTTHLQVRAMRGFLLLFVVCFSKTFPLLGGTEH